jgi:hypothetical protein
MPLEIRQPQKYWAPEGNKKTRKTINHTFCKCIAKMANLSQYCTPPGSFIRYPLNVNRLD